MACKKETVDVLLLAISSVRPHRKPQDRRYAYRQVVVAPEATHASRKCLNTSENADPMKAAQPEQGHRAVDGQAAGCVNTVVYEPVQSVKITATGQSQFVCCLARTKAMANTVHVP